MATPCQALQWQDALRCHSMFTHLRECASSEDSDIAVSYSRGDVFVWDPGCQVILSTNLKRHHANIVAAESDCEQHEIFQLLHPSAFPPTPPTSISPSPNGRYLALIGTGYVYVMELWRQRGPNGEFNGGVAEVDCRTVAIGDTLIRAHRLTVIQANWHHDDSIIGILSNDGSLRLYMISNPLVPHITLRVSEPHSTYTRTLSLDEGGVAISFSFLTNSIVLLQDRMDIQTVIMKDGEQSSPPLPMYPMDKDNYSDTASDMLVILSRPPVVVMATANGQLLHGVLLESEGSDSDEENEIIASESSITIIESLSLEMEESAIKLVSDPSIHHMYCVVTLTDVYCIKLPWLRNLQQFGQDAGIPFAANPPSIDNHLLRSPKQNISNSALVVDSILGMCLLVTFKDGDCIPVSLDFHSTDTVCNPLTTITTPGPAPELPLTNPFVTHIQDLLSTAKESHPLPKKLDVSGNPSQEQCFQYLQDSLILLRQRSMAAQQTAATKLNGRVQLLVRRRERQVNDMLSLEESCDEIRDNGSTLQDRLRQLQESNRIQLNKVENILSTVTTSSPVLSEAERTLAKDLTLIKEQLVQLELSLAKASQKVSLGLANSAHGKLNLNAEKLDTILVSLSDDGTAIKNNVKTIKELALSLGVEISLAK